MEFIKEFELYDLEVNAVNKSATRRSMILLEQNLSIEKNNSNAFVCSTFNHFPVLIEHSGRVWSDGTLFLLTYLKGIKQPEASTLRSIATDLTSFYKWCTESERNYRDVSSTYMHGLPTYRFSRFLRDAVESGTLAKSTATRRMGVVKRFYSWLRDNGIIEGVQLWRERDGMVVQRSEHSFIHTEISISDIVTSIRRVPVDPKIASGLIDGRQLRPLTICEIALLRDALRDTNNIEMELAFELALLTGARLETVFTLRALPFELVNFGSESLRINVGGSSLVKTKYNKSYTLIVPRKIVDKINIYLKSPRRAKRLRIGPHYDDLAELQYLFLTRSGKCYYLDKSDSSSKHYERCPDGNSVIKFIHQTLRPRLKNSSFGAQFTFHDLRATFGVQLVDFERRRVASSENIKNEVNPADNIYMLNYVSQRMGHSNLTTTERYLTFSSNHEFRADIQRSFEEQLLGSDTGFAADDIIAND